MRTLYIRWILPVVALVIITAAILIGEFSTEAANAAAIHHTKKGPSHTTSAPAAPPAPRYIMPDSAWSGM